MTESSAPASDEGGSCELHPCMDCGERAEVHWCRISPEEVRTEQHLCKRCADKRGIDLEHALEVWPEELQ